MLPNTNYFYQVILVIILILLIIRVKVYRNEPYLEQNDFKYLGCYRDDKQRFLKGKRYIYLKDNSQKKCAEICKKDGYKYFGLQYGKQCYCDNKPERGFGTKLDDKLCNMPCTGNKSTTCGGVWTNQIYEIEQTKPEEEEDDEESLEEEAEEFAKPKPKQQTVNPQVKPDIKNVIIESGPKFSEKTYKLMLSQRPIT